MFSRDRLCQLAVGIILVLAFPALGQETQSVPPPATKSQPIPESGQNASKGKGAANSQEKQPAPEQLTPSLNKIEAAIRDLIAQQRATQNHPPEKHEISDLEAQEGMALWAQAMFWASLAAVVLTFVAIALIWRTLHHTRRAANYAGDMVVEAKATTEAANKSIEVTRDSAERQSRAYMHPSGPKLTMHEDGKISLFVKFQNYGQTPAYEVIVRISLTVTPLPLDEKKLAEAATDQPMEASQGTIGPGQEITSDLEPPFTLTPKYRDDIATNKAGIFLHGEIKYRDAFNEPRITHYCAIYTGPWGGEQGFRICPEGNDAT